MRHWIEPRAYVACLASYNAGRLHGVWVSGDDAEEIEAAIAGMLASSPAAGAEEYAVHDQEGFGRLLGEQSGAAEIAAWSALIAQHGLDTIAGVARCVGCDPDIAAVTAAMDRVVGVYGDWPDFAAACEYDSGVIADRTAPYIDWQAWGRDYERGGEYFRVRSGPGRWSYFTNE